MISLNSLKQKVMNNTSLVNFIQYGLVGILGTIVHTSILAFSVEILIFPAVLATTIGFLFSLVLSYYLNSMWTFKKRRRSKHSFIKYALTCSIGLIINVFIMFVIADILELWYMVGQVISIIVVPLFNFNISRRWAFEVKKENE